MSDKRHFTPDLFAFLRDLKANNDRDWFQRHKKRYEEQVREPALEFIRDFEPYLEAVSPHFRADDRKVGGSLFRIHRDVRFSKDKSPYKTHTGIQFRHDAGKDAHAPGYYLHLEPRRVFMGAGLWRPDGTALRAIRDAIVEDPEGWRSVTEGGELTRHWELEGESLKTAPRGFDIEHPLIEDLRRKDFIAVRQLTQGEITRSDFIETFAGYCGETRDFVSWLCRAVDVPF